MITCTINGRRACPLLTNKIKITLENAQLKDRNEWTMDIVFPMDIHENAVIFGHCNRLQVSKRVQKYDDCRLFADNSLIIRGVGIISSASDREVKLQIKSGMQRIAYQSDFERIYIDQISYPVPVQDWLDNWIEAGSLHLRQTGDWRFSYAPVYDETNDKVLNGFSVLHKPIYTGSPGYGAVQSRIYVKVINAAIQPGLQYVIGKALEHMGYRIQNEEWWIEMNLPLMWICNARMTRDIAKALPHWSIKRFLDEVRKLLNVIFVFDDINNQVQIIRNNPREAEAVEYECLDEFTTDLDESGLQYSGSSNIEYNLSPSSYRIPNDDISDRALDTFDTLEYSSYGAMLAAWEKMDEKNKLTHIFHCPSGWYYTHKYGEGVCDIERAKFQHIRREDNAENTVTLNIAPVAIGRIDLEIPMKWAYWSHEGGPDSAEDRYEYETINTSEYLPCIENSEGENSEEYMTVQSVVEAESVTEKEEAKRMEVMFLGYPQRYFIYNFGDRGVNWDNGTVIVRFQLEGTIGTAIYNTDPETIPSAGAPMSFSLAEVEGCRCIGDLHLKEKVIENREQVVIKFLVMKKPDPCKIFLFRNKKYLCDKIELNVTEDGIEEIATGYFYEIT